MLVEFEPGGPDFMTPDLLGELSAEPFTLEFFRSCELADRYSLDHALGLARVLGLEDPLAERPHSAEELADALGFARDFRPALEWILERLAADGQLHRDAAAGAPRFRLDAPLRPSEVAELRRLGLALDARLAATLDLYDAAAAAYPAVASARATGEQELLSGGRIALWLAYFHPANAVYAISNRIAADAAANRLPAKGGLRLLEVGAGAGSGTVALLEELERRERLADVESFLVTEPNAFFRRRAERLLAERFPTVPLEFGGFDIDRSVGEQGFEGKRVDLVLAVNVLHVAKNLGRALANLRDLLAPGGWLVAGEAQRLFPGQPLPAELVFRLLNGYNSVELDARIRPKPGFQEPAVWRLALASAGLTDVAVVPDLERIRDVYPRFFTGAACGRRAFV